MKATKINQEEMKARMEVNQQKMNLAIHTLHKMRGQ
jgi:hypothetical protein